MDAVRAAFGGATATRSVCDSGEVSEAASNSAKRVSPNLWHSPALASLSLNNHTIAVLRLKKVEWPYRFIVFCRIFFNNIHRWDFCLPVGPGKQVVGVDRLGSSLRT
jgi:hypothetical protein